MMMLRKKDKCVRMSGKREAHPTETVVSYETLPLLVLQLRLCACLQIERNLLAHGQESLSVCFSLFFSLPSTFVELTSVSVRVPCATVL